MKAFIHLMQLRVIGGLVCVGAALPLISLRAVEDPLRGVFGLFQHSAPILFLISVAIWVPLFAWMRSRSGMGMSAYLLCGIVLGIAPALVYSLANALAGQPFVTFNGLVAGIVTGGFVGWGIWRWSDGWDGLSRQQETERRA